MANADLDKQPDSVSSVLKVFGILQALGEEREIGITELSQRVMMSKSTVYRFLQTMKTLGYVAQEGESEKYSLTLKLFELGARALQNVDLIRSADIQMREISRLTKETIHLGALDEDSIVYIHKIDSMYNLRMYSRIGRRNPLYSTAIGKVLLAWRDRDEVMQILEGVETLLCGRSALSAVPSGPSPVQKRYYPFWTRCASRGMAKIMKSRKKGCDALRFRYLIALAWSLLV